MLVRPRESVQVQLYCFFNLGARWWQVVTIMHAPQLPTYIPSDTRIRLPSILTPTCMNNSEKYLKLLFSIFNIKCYQNPFLNCVLKNKLPTGLNIKKKVWHTANFSLNSLRNFHLKWTSMWYLIPEIKNVLGCLGGILLMINTHTYLCFKRVWNLWPT